MFGFPPVPAPIVPRYYCHQCSREVNTYVANEERVCSSCNETFVEELETPPVQQTPPPSPFANLFQHFAQQLQSQPRPQQAPQQPIPLPFANLFNSVPPQPTGQTQQVPPGLPDFPFIQQMLNVLSQSMGSAGANGDIFNVFNINGRGQSSMEELLNRLFEEHMNNGPPPTDKEFVASLPRREITRDDEAEEIECSVCKDNFVAKEEVLVLPCKHLYHPDCILPWLKDRNTCPTCRYELPEQKKEESSRGNTPPSPDEDASGPHHETDHLYM